MIRVVAVTVILALSIASQVWLLVWLIRRRKLQRLTPVSLPMPSAARTYGHPRSPTKALWAKLPVLPGDYSWETKVEARDNGRYYLCLALVDVAKAANVAETSVDLTWCRTHGQPHVTCYLSYDAIANDLFMEEIIAPLVGWATTQVTKLHAGEVYDYQLGKEQPDGR